MLGTRYEKPAEKPAENPAESGRADSQDSAGPASSEVRTAAFGEARQRHLGRRRR